MERARHRKSKSASGIEGIQQTQKQKAASRLSSDSRSYVDGSYNKDMFILEFEQANAMPMKKLLAEEMSKEIESKRRAPSVIARLMGLEGMPSPRRPHRQPKKFTDTYQQKNASQENNQLYDGLYNRTSSTNQHEYKDVYVDLETSHVGTRLCSSRWRENSMLTKPEMAFIKQKFIDVKRLSTDEKFQNSKELDDALEMLDSNKDLLLKFLQQQDSLFVNRVSDLQLHSGRSVGKHTAVLRPSNSDKNTASKHRMTSHLKRQDGLLLEPHNRHRTRISQHSLKNQLEDKTDENILPTRIVVLKPNIGRMASDDGSGSLSNLLHGYKKSKEFPLVGDADTVSWTINDPLCNVGSSKPISKEARKIAREITKRMRNGCAESDRKSAAFNGYVGDESSYSANESDSESETEAEIFKLSSRKTNNVNLSRYSPSRLGKSSVNSEGKKRLSERWKMSHKYQDLEKVNKANTLGEMLSLPDNEAMPRLFSAKMSLDIPNNRVADLNSPLGISSRDGWKDNINKKASRSKSLPPSTRGRSYKRSTHHHAQLDEDRSLLPGTSVHCKIVKGNLSPKDYSFTDSISRSRKPHHCPQIVDNDTTDPTSKVNFEIQMEANTKAVSNDGMCRSPLVDEVMIVETRCPDLSSKSSGFATHGSKSAVHDQEDSSFQKLEKELPNQGCPSSRCSGAEPDSSESSKEADHPSPISVLEVPSTDDALSCESFERVGAELHELRMQLQLLKMESGSPFRASTLVPIEEEVALPSPDLSEADHISEAKDWESSYVVDVLISSGLDESDFDPFKPKWRFPDCPLDPNLFENLEKKYSDNTVGSRSERRLLFDRVNSAMLEVFNKHFNLCHWFVPKLAGLNTMKEGILEAMEELLHQEYANENISEKMIVREMQWSGGKGEFEIEAVGCEIEKLLVDEMITEVVIGR